MSEDKTNDSSSYSNHDVELDHEATKITCDVLCSLIASSTACHESNDNNNEDSEDPSTEACPSKQSKRPCLKQLQLPLFLSKTYHMIDRCDPSVACWSESGDNFIVKDVDTFSATVLPLFFKHSNFQSFARQLNFYGFRKLRSEAILTSELEPRTAHYIRFYHEHFQRGKPQLLSNIKRATKAEQHSKDDLESLKQEVTSLREELQAMKSEYKGKITELSYECNRRITSMNAEYDKLALFVQQSLGVAAVAVASSVPQQHHHHHQQQQSSVGGVPDLLHSLSHAAAMTLQMRPPALPVEQKQAASNKRSPSSLNTTTNGSIAKKPHHPSDRESV